jgi:hypothetical protein
VLFDRHAKAIYNFLFRRTTNWSEAEDLTSAVFLQAWRRRAEVVLDRESALPPPVSPLSATSPPRPPPPAERATAGSTPSRFPTPAMTERPGCCTTAPGRYHSASSAARGRSSVGWLNLSIFPGPAAPGHEETADLRPRVEQLLVHCDVVTGSCEKLFEKPEADRDGKTITLGKP